MKYALYERGLSARQPNRDRWILSAVFRSKSIADDTARMLYPVHPRHERGERINYFQVRKFA